MVTKEQLDEIIAKYNRGEPTGYSDEEYDRLLEEYLQTHGGESARPFNRQQQSDSVNDLVGTLGKCYGVTNPMREGQKTYDQWVKTNQLRHDQFIILQPKFDGCSVACDFTTGRFFTRGDYDNGESVDVTELFEHKLKWIREEILWGYEDTTAMKFEAILSHEQFHDAQLNLRYKRPRDVVAAAITSRDQNLAKMITLVPLRGTINGKQYIPNILRNISWILACDAYPEMISFIKHILNDDAKFTLFEQTYSIDGVVASKLEDGVIGEHEIHLPAYDDPTKEIAIKILYNVQKTKLITVDYQYGKPGRITPVAILEPVKFDNVTVDRVTLSTLDRVLELKLRHNDTVRIMYNIVPYLIDSEHDGDYPIQIPKKCPICGAELEFVTLRQVKCPNPNCKGRKIGSIIRHAEKMKMMGISRGIITKLFDKGILSCIEDLYKLRDWEQAIIDMDGFGFQSYWNIVNSINDALHNATLDRFLGSLPIEDTSEETWKTIIKVMGEQPIIDSMIDQTFPERIMAVGYIPNVGELKVRRIINGYILNADQIRSMMEWIPYQLKHTDKKVKFKGKVGMSGTRDSEVTKKLVAAGYEVGSFTNDCVALVVPSHDFNSAKVEKAKQQQIPIYTLSEVLSKLI